jgi:hypothetical protein
MHAYKTNSETITRTGHVFLAHLTTMFLLVLNNNPYIAVPVIASGGVSKSDYTRSNEF